MAAKGTSHDDLIAAFESRFDYYSARVMVGEALSGAGLDEKKSYSDADIGAITEAIDDIAPGAADVITEALGGDAKAPAKKSDDKKSDDKKAEDKKADDKKSDDKKSDDKKADDKKSDDKKADDKKSDDKKSSSKKSSSKKSSSKKSSSKKSSSKKK